MISQVWVKEMSVSEPLKNTNFQFWQQNYKPIELSDTKMIDQKLNYLHNNPVEEGFVIESHHYKYSSAIDYADGKGLIEVLV